ncbi:MAG: DUF1569 domain-containing protein [Planctomycetota bacterium]
MARYLLRERLDSLLERVDRLTPGSPRKWGKMTVDEAVVHMTDALRICTSEVPAKDGSNFFTRVFLKPLMLYAPWPKGAPTPPAAKTNKPESWDSDIAKLKEMLKRVAAMGPDDTWGVHPMLGHISAKHAHRMMWRHANHHLRQFSV